jgi:hypothetical protein
MEGNDIKIIFSGPYSWHGSSDAPSLFESPLGGRSGIYLWTVPHSEGSLIYYVGETGRSFGVRFFEHFKEHFSGCYHIYEPTSLSKGDKVTLWAGKYDKSFKFSFSSLIERFTELAPAITEHAKLYRFFLAPMDCEKRFRERVEAAIAKHLYDQPGVIGKFQEGGIRYRPRMPKEEGIWVSIETEAKIMGLPSRLMA